jgi:exopolysaccharide biosynthesis polyprenyl glycosylphosphotransferase
MTVLSGQEKTTAAPAAMRRYLTFRGYTRDALRRRVLATADVLAGIAVSLSLLMEADGGVALATWSLPFLPAWLLVAKLLGLYDRDHRSLRHLTADELGSIFIWATTGTAALVLFLEASPAGAVGLSDAVRIWLVAAGVAIVLRGLARAAWRRLTPPEQMLIVGTGPLADATRRKLELFPDIHADLIGEQPSATYKELDETSLMGVDRVVLASASFDEMLFSQLIASCRRHGVKLSVVPPVRGMFGTAAHLSHVADLPIIEYNTWHVSRSTLVLKRVLDVVVSATALVVTSPLFVLVAVSIALTSKGPVLFRQVRIGAKGRPFIMFKFRTMVANAQELRPQLVPLAKLPEPVFKLPRDPRVTRLGRLLRKTSLDELPQFINVLKGDMSLVGPRPEEADVVASYADEHRFRLEVKPGLTGPMQVYGRGELSFQERLAVEREYIENLSIGRDLRLLAMTVIPVLSGRGAF